MFQPNLYCKSFPFVITCPHTLTKIFQQCSQSISGRPRKHMTEFYTKDSSLPTEVVQDICRYLETWCVWGRTTLCWLAHFAPFIEKMKLLDNGRLFTRPLSLSTSKSFSAFLYRCRLVFQIILSRKPPACCRYNLMP